MNHHFNAIWIRERATEVFDTSSRFLLKSVASYVAVLLRPFLNARCFHSEGGAKALIAEVHAFVETGDFVFKTDVYSYYASMRHSILLEQLHSLSLPLRLIHLVGAYITRTVWGYNSVWHPTQGIPKGGSLSPILGAVYLNGLDRQMETLMSGGDFFYGRFQDDILIIARTRHGMRRARKILYAHLDALILGLRCEKTFVGRAHKGFDFLGYHIRPAQPLTLSPLSTQKALYKACDVMREKGPQALAAYLKRFGSYATAGLKKASVSDVDKTIDSIRTHVVSLNYEPRRRWSCPPPSGKNVEKSTWESILCQESSLRY